MITEQEQLVNNFKKTIELVKSNYLNLKEEKKALESQVPELMQVIESQRNEMNNLRAIIENYQMAKAIEGTAESSHEARNRVTKIVKEIDNCIALLNR